MKRINEMFLLVVVLLTTTLTGCPMGSPPPTATGLCSEEGDSQLCTTAGGCAGIQICGRGGSSPDLHWSMCTGPSGTCTPGMDAGTLPGTDSGALADAGTTDDAGGMLPTDGGMSGTDGGMPGGDAGPTCDPSVVRTCTGACGVPGATGFLVDSCDPTSPCVDDLTDPTGGCTTVPTPFCPCSGAACSLLVACITPCDFVGVQTVQDYCRGDACYPVFPESCMPMTDAGMMSVDAGMDAGPPAMTDAGMDAGSDAGTDAGSCACTVDDCYDACGNLGLFLCVGGVRSTTCTPYMSSPAGGGTTSVGTGDACRPGRTPLPCSGGLVLFDDASGAYNTFCSPFIMPGLCGPDAGPPDAGAPDAGTDAGPPPMMDAGSDAGPGMTDAGAGVDAGMDAGMDAGSDAGSSTDAGSDAGMSVDAGSDSGVPPGIPSTGYAVWIDPSFDWCPVGGTLEARSWDNQDNDIPNTEDMHYGASPLTVPIGPTGHVLTGSFTNDTVYCRTGSGIYMGYYSPRLRSATNGTTCRSLGVRTFINGAEIPCFVCWDTGFAWSPDPRSTEYRRLQSRLTPDVSAHLACQSGTLTP